MDKENLETENKTAEIDSQKIPSEKTKPEPSDETGELKKQLQEKEKEAKDAFDRLLRVRADFDNYQKRVKKERQEFERFASEGLVKELLPVIDNLERAINSTKVTGEIAPLVEGLEMTIKQFKDALKNAGLSEIKSVGEIFDPSKHEAIKLITPHEGKDNTVIEEYEKGYLLHDRVIRPSRVGVARNRIDKAEVGE